VVLWDAGSANHWRTRSSEDHSDKSSASAQRSKESSKQFEAAFGPSGHTRTRNITHSWKSDFIHFNHEVEVYSCSWLLIHD
jgi:hypothetical protein